MSAQPSVSPVQRLAELEVYAAGLEKRLVELEAFVAVLRAAIGGASANGVGAIATDTDLSGKYGDPKVKLTPRDWGGAPRKGWQLSRCEPEFLDLYAETLEFFARKNDEEGAKASNGTPKSRYDRADAARARGWAKRLRAGWAAPQPAQRPATTGGGWGAGARQAPPPPTSVDDPYAPRGEEPPAEEENEDDSIPF